MTGFFILAGNIELPFVYNVRVVRDGRNYSVRTVDVTQEETKGICFTCTCSFKKPDTAPFGFQERLDIGKEYASVLEGRRPEDHADAPSIEALWFVFISSRHGTETCKMSLQADPIGSAGFAIPRKL